MGFLIKAAAGPQTGIQLMLARRLRPVVDKATEGRNAMIAKQVEDLQQGQQSGGKVNGRRSIAPLADMQWTASIDDLADRGWLDNDDLVSLGRKPLKKPSREITDGATIRYMRRLANSMSQADWAKYNAYVRGQQVGAEGMAAVSNGVYYDVLRRLIRANGGKLTRKAMMQARYIADNSELLLAQNKTLDIDGLLQKGLDHYRNNLSDLLKDGFEDARYQSRQRLRQSKSNNPTPKGTTPDNTPGNTPDGTPDATTGKPTGDTPGVRTGDATAAVADDVAATAGQTSGGKVRKGLLGWRNLAIGAGGLGLAGSIYATVRPGEASAEEEDNTRNATVDSPSNAAFNYYNELQSNPYRYDTSITGMDSIGREGFNLNAQRNRQLSNMFSSQPGVSFGQPGVPPGTLFDAIRLYQ